MLIATLKARVRSREEHSRLEHAASTFAGDLSDDAARPTDLFATAIAIDARTVVSLVVAGPPGGRTSEEADRFWNTLRIAHPAASDVARLHTRSGRR